MKKENLDTKYYKVKNFNNNKPYLDYTLGIDWKVENIINTECKDGYIVQKVEIVDTTNISRSIIYYEAWKVENQKYIKHSDSKADDTFRNSAILESIGKKGTVEYFSEIYWIDKKNILYKFIDNWEEGKVPEAGNLKSEWHDNCHYLHSCNFVYRRDKFTHKIDFIDGKVIKENIKIHFQKRRYIKTKEFYSDLKNELIDTPYIWIVEQIREEWETL